MLRVTLNWRADTHSAAERLSRLIACENFYHLCSATWYEEHPAGWQVKESKTRRILTTTDEAIALWMRLHAPAWAVVEEV